MRADPLALAAQGLEDGPVERPAFATPGDLALAIDPQVVQTPALELIDSALVDVAEGRCDRLMINMPPQEGKSWRVTTATPLWMLTRNPDLRIAVLSYGQDLADEFGRNIRNYITSNEGDDGTLDLGLRIAPDNGAARRWRIDGHRGGVRSVGIAGGLTGRPADAVFIDDPFKSEQDAVSKAWRERVWSVWQSVVNTRLAPGAPAVLVMTRWHEDDLAGRLLAAEDGHRWRVINIPAQADHDPGKGETDPLGREPGEFMESSRRRTTEQWEQIRVAVGSRVWGALYQGHPSPADGGIFKRDWWRTYEHAPYVEHGGVCELLAMDAACWSWDLAFKDTDGSDYVVGQVWGRRGTDAFLIHQVRGRWDFTETARQIELGAVRFPHIPVLIEDKANGPAVISHLRQRVAAIIPVTPKDSKQARASAVAPFVEAGNVHLPAPHLAPWIGDWLEELSAFPNAAHDDQVDAATQALHRLFIGHHAGAAFLDELVQMRR